MVFSFPAVWKRGSLQINRYCSILASVLEMSCSGRRDRMVNTPCWHTQVLGSLTWRRSIHCRRDVRRVGLNCRIQFWRSCPNRPSLTFFRSVLQCSLPSPPLLCCHQCSCVLGSARARAAKKISPIKVLGSSPVTPQCRFSHRGSTGGISDCRTRGHPHSQPAENSLRATCLEMGRAKLCMGWEGERDNSHSQQQRGEAWAVPSALSHSGDPA